VDKDGKVGFEFQKREPKAKTGAAKKAKEPQPKIDFTGQESLGPCPKCGARVFESETEYLCEKSQADTKPCKFRAGKIILQQPIDRVQIAKLLADGKTDLLDKFVSRHGKPFSAWLIVGEDGKVAFEFPPREAEASSEKVKT
jgi:DNA topoisomerase-3